jgi:starch synthase (maltosyl-transferring)
LPLPEVKSQTKQPPGYPHNDYQWRMEDALAMPRIAIESLDPVVEQGRFAAKAIVGTPVRVSAVIFADGHR